MTYAQSSKYADVAQLNDELDISIRHGFVRKVFGIVFTQLAVTCLIALPFLLQRDQIKETLGVKGLKGMCGGAWGTTIFLLLCIACCPKNGRKYPKNYIILSLITFCCGLSLGGATLFQKVEVILYAFALTAGISFLLVAFALQTRIDFYGCGPHVFMAMILLMIFVGLSFLWERSEKVTLLLCGIQVVLVSFLMLLDVQMIVGGKHRRFKFSVDDYVFAAISLYIDTITLFLHILKLVGVSED